MNPQFDRQPSRETAPSLKVALLCTGVGIVLNVAAAIPWSNSSPEDSSSPNGTLGASTDVGQESLVITRACDQDLEASYSVSAQ